MNRILMAEPGKHFLDEPSIINTIDTNAVFDIVRLVACINDKIWTCGNNGNFLRLFELNGTQVSSIQNKIRKQTIRHSSNKEWGSSLY